MPNRFQFGEFDFDAGSGELRRQDGAAAEQLPPQPASLLTLLVDRGGGIVTRQEIRDRLWPDTHVDFDASLHFCVRQLRAALGDSAAEPRYIQNVPRRGYRLLPDVTAVSDTGQAAAAAPSRRRMIAALAGVVTAPIAWFAYRGVNALGDSPRVRIAIMPFEPPIAETVLERLSQIGGESAGLVGPTTTSAYVGSDAGLKRLATEYRVDYVVNG